MFERQRAAQDAHQDAGHDLPHDESVMEAHVPGADGDAGHRPHSEHLRHKLPGESSSMTSDETTLRTEELLVCETLFLIII